MYFVACRPGSALDPSDETKEKFYINQMYAGIEWIANRRGATLRDVLSNEGGVLRGRELLARIEKELNSGEFYIEPLTVGGTNQLVDSWGNRYIAVWRVDYSRPDVPGDLISDDREIVIWSAGPNGVNEHGNGDDVYRSKDL